MKGCGVVALTLVSSLQLLKTGDHLLWVDGLHDLGIEPELLV